MSEVIKGGGDVGHNRKNVKSSHEKSLKSDQLKESARKSSRKNSVEASHEESKMESENVISSSDKNTIENKNTNPENISKDKKDTIDDYNEKKPMQKQTSKPSAEKLEFSDEIREIGSKEMTSLSGRESHRSGNTENDKIEQPMKITKTDGDKSPKDAPKDSQVTDHEVQNDVRVHSSRSISASEKYKIEELEMGETIKSSRSVKSTGKSTEPSTENSKASDSSEEIKSSRSAKSTDRPTGPSNENLKTPEDGQEIQSSRNTKSTDKPTVPSIENSKESEAGSEEIKSSRSTKSTGKQKVPSTNNSNQPGAGEEINSSRSVKSINRGEASSTDNTKELRTEEDKIKSSRSTRSLDNQDGQSTEPKARGENNIVSARCVTPLDKAESTSLESVEHQAKSSETNEKEDIKSSTSKDIATTSETCVDEEDASEQKEAVLLEFPNDSAPVKPLPKFLRQKMANDGIKAGHRRGKSNAKQSPSRDDKDTLSKTQHAKRANANTMDTRHGRSNVRTSPMNETLPEARAKVKLENRTRGFDQQPISAFDTAEITMETSRSTSSQEADEFARILCREVDDINEMLDEALLSRRKIEALYMKNSSNRDKFAFASMYKKFNDLPSTKSAMFDEINKLRAAMKEQEENFKQEVRTLKHENDKLATKYNSVSAELAAVVGERDSLNDAVTKAKGQSRRQAKQIESLQMEKRDIIQRHDTIKEKTEAHCNSQIQSLQAKHAEEIKKLKMQRDELELKVDEYRGLLVNRDVQLLEMQMGYTAKFGE